MSFTEGKSISLYPSERPDQEWQILFYFAGSIFGYDYPQNNRELKKRKKEINMSTPIRTSVVAVLFICYF